jgi:hypothetical protein
MITARMAKRFPVILVMDSLIIVSPSLLAITNKNNKPQAPVLF